MNGANIPDMLKLSFPKIKLVIYNTMTLLIGYSNPQLRTVIGSVIYVNTGFIV